VDEDLVLKLIARDWPKFAEACERLDLGTPTREGVRTDMIITAPGTEEEFRSVLFCDGYDAQAPLLDFADIDTGTSVGKDHWPQMTNAPMNSITYEGRLVPILCVRGTRGYHLHESHRSETHPRSTWALAAVATVIWRLFNQWGSLQGRGV
jgi:hypothetical protein